MRRPTNLAVALSQPAGCASLEQVEQLCAVRRQDQEGRRRHGLPAVVRPPIRLLVFSLEAHFFALGSYHIYGLVVILHHSIWQNTPVVIHSKFDPRLFLESITAHRISTLYLVPPQVIFMVKQDDLVKQFDLSSVRMVMAGAAPLTDEVRPSVPLALRVGPREAHLP